MYQILDRSNDLVRDRWHVAVYMTAALEKKVKLEATRRRRPYGPTVVEILEEYFAKENDARKKSSSRR